MTAEILFLQEDDVQISGSWILSEIAFLTDCGPKPQGSKHLHVEVRSGMWFW